MRSFLRILVIALILAAFGATVEAVRVRSLRAEDRAAMRIGVDDVARRVRTTTANLARATELNNRSILAKARALARLVAADPSIAADQARFESLCAPLDVEELHLSDEKGILVRSVPRSSVGFDMNSADQPRPFMQAIADRNFELVQEPSVKPTDGKLFQYAGVARIDKPGIVQVGHRAERVEEARRLADIEEIATTTRIGRDGRVFISKVSSRSRGANADLREEKVGDERQYVLDADVGTHHVHITMPVHGFFLADDLPFSLLCVLDALLILVMFVSRLESVRAFLTRHCHALVVLFSDLPSAQAQPSRHTTSPVILACLAMFVLMTGACWMYFSRTARTVAENRLRNAAADMHEDIDNCVDQLMLYQGNAICKSYGSPEAMTVDTVREVMRRYDLDELNVVNRHGIIIAGDLAEVGFDMASNANTAKFNCLLEGETTYSQPFRGAIENPELRRKYAGIAFPPPAKGYIQIGFAEHRLKDGIDYRFEAMAKDWRIGQRGFFVVAKDKTGAIDSCGKRDERDRPVFRKGDTLAGIGFDVKAVPKDPNRFFTATLYGEKCLCLSEVLSFHRSIAAIPLSEITGGFRRMLATTVAVLFGIFLLVAVFMTRLAELVASLKGYIVDARKRDEKDMAMAKAIQYNVLPATFPPYPELADRMDVFARMITARDVGGDFYDFYFVARNKLALVIADVSGKGVPAALFMMRAKTTVQSLLKGGRDIAEAVREANDRLSENNEANMFVTAWIAVVDIGTGEVEYVNAGHNPPLVRRVDGTVSFLTEKSGPPLAAVGGVSFRRKTTRLAAGESLVLYTDGVTEAVNPMLELYGDARLRTTVEGLLSPACTSTAVVNGIVESVSAFANGAEQADDITLLAFRLI